MDKMTDYYDEFLNIYNMNKSNDWNTWLEYDSTLKIGTQGIVGILRMRQKPGLKCIFKMSQHINYLISHENDVMSELNKLQEICPNFCRSFGMITAKTNPSASRDDNPFDISSCKCPLEKEILLMEYLQNNWPLMDFVNVPSELFNPNIITSVMYQVFFAIYIAQKHTRFTHYDLHSRNILIKKCDANTCFSYRTGDQKIQVPTYGYYPIIIDFGFSFVGALNDLPLRTSLAHTDAGFFCYTHDPINDYKLFVVSLSELMARKHPKIKFAKKFRNFAKSLFEHVRIDWQTGWWETEKEISALRHVVQILRPYNFENNYRISQLFYSQEPYIFDILNTLITLPIEEYCYDSIGKYYVLFLKEWAKIENIIMSPYYQIAMFKIVVDAAREVRGNYYDSVLRENAICDFRALVEKGLDSIGKFCKIENLNYDVMLCSLFIFANKLEGCYHHFVLGQELRKNDEFETITYPDPESIVSYFYKSFPISSQYEDGPAQKFSYREFYNPKMVYEGATRFPKNLQTVYEILI